MGSPIASLPSAPCLPNIKLSSPHGRLLGQPYEFPPDKGEKGGFKISFCQQGEGMCAIPTLLATVFFLRFFPVVQFVILIAHLK